MAPEDSHEVPIAPTPEPPYVAVIFTSLRTDSDSGYSAMAEEMERLAQQQPGYLGMESVRNEHGAGITVSYWASPEHARGWKRIAEHVQAQRLGRTEWYRCYRVRIARVEREYGFDREASAAGRTTARSTEGH
jgi:heme-degrading monooxygenase HmoA